MASTGKPTDGLSRLRQRFSARLDTEHEQAIIRLILGVLLVVYFTCIPLYSDVGTRDWNAEVVRPMFVFILAAVLLLVHVAVYPQISPVRRILGATLDCGTVIVFMFIAGESA